MKWAGNVVAAACLVFLLGMSAATAKVYIDHPRDEAGFLRDAHIAGGKHAAARSEMTDQQLLSAGESACAWLHDQPMALWRRTERFGTATLMERYSPGRDAVGTSGIAYDAWDHLCPATFALIKPHRVSVPGHWGGGGGGEGGGED